MKEEYKDSPLGIIPSDWKFSTLSEITKIYDGTHQTPVYLSEGIPFYSVEHVTANNFSNTKFISEEVFEKENQRVRLQKGDILMTRIGDVGTVKYINWDVNASFYVSLALIKQQLTFSGKYLTQFIKSNTFQNELWKRIIHTAFPKKINLGEIGKCHVVLPPLPEQQKIAEILSTVDDKIETIDHQITENKKLKKGLMQHLLTKGIAHKEFKDSPLGMIPKSWEVVQVQEISKVIDSLHKTPVFSDKGYPMVRVGDINKDSLNLNNCLKVNEEVLNDFNKNHKPKTGDILMTRVGSFGKTILVKTEEIFCIGQNTVVITKISNPEFLYQIFNSSQIQKQLNLLTNGSSQPSLSLKDIRHLQISYPPKKEQERIANILSSIDEKVEVLAEKKINYQELKQGLMQQLLTGKIRVKV